MSPTIPATLRDWVIERDHSRCAYCRSPESMSISAFEVDHIVPRHSGGHTEQNNLCYCCPSCNRFKATRQRAVDPETGDQVPLFHPRTQTWSDHFQFDEGNAVLEGRTPTGRATIAALHMNRPSLVQLRRLWRKLGIAP